MNGLSSLMEAIETVPLPGTPPALSTESAAVGLAFLDMALRQNHVRRLTERLTLVEHQAAARTTEVDIRLSLLDERQREASSVFQRLTSRSARKKKGKSTSSLWVPVTRISRRSVSPIDVFDAHGGKLPRLTQHETTALLASGLYSLLHGILMSQAEGLGNSDVGQFLFRIDESRWLLQAALIALLMGRSRPDSKFDKTPAPGTSGAHGKQYRKLATDVLENNKDGLLSSYTELLDIAVNDYLLVVALDTTRDDHILRYDSPLHVQRPEFPKGTLPRLLRAQSSRYRVTYHAKIPSNLRSYHVVAETEPSVHIESMTLVTNADEAIANDVVRDLKFLAKALRDDSATPTLPRKLLELEVQSVLGQVSELLRKRRWEADQAGAAFAFSKLGATTALAQAYVAGEGLRNDDGKVRASLLRHPYVTPENLEKSAQELDSCHLKSDFWLENDPTSSRAHVYWRRTARQSDARHTDVQCDLTLSDAVGIGPSSVLAYMAAVVAIIYLAGSLIARSPLPFGRVDSIPVPQAASNADAIVAVLLLVPGFLYTRLGLPSKFTIIGQLRATSRQVAYICMAAAVLVATTIAAGLVGRAFQWVLAVGLLLPIFASLPLLLTHFRREGARIEVPLWLQRAHDRRRSAKVDAVFFSSGADRG